MDWSKVFFVIFSLLSLTMSAVFLYSNNIIVLFLALVVNFLSATIRIGVRNFMAAEILGASLVALGHLAAAFIFIEVLEDYKLTHAMMIGALIAATFALVLSIIESAKYNTED